MTSVKISNLTAATALTGTEMVPVVQSGVTVRAQVNDLLTYANISVSQTVATLAALKALTTRPEAVIVETGQAAGVWQWALASTTTADDALVVTPTSGTAGRYKRLHNNQMDPRWFGAVCDGSTDDTAAWVAACTAILGLGGGTLVVPPLSQKVNGPVTYTGDNLAIVGDVTSSRIIKASTTGNLFAFTGDKFTFDGFLVDCSGTHTAGTLFALTTTNGNVWMTNLFTNAGFSVLTLGAGSQLFIDNCVFNNFLKDGIRPGTTWGGLTNLSNLEMNCTSSNDGAGIYLESGDTFVLSNINCATQKQPVVFQPIASGVLVNIFCTNVLADGVGRSSGFDGFTIVGSAASCTLARIFLANCWAGANQRDGFRIVGSVSADVVQLDNCISISNVGHGIYLTGNPTHVRIRNCLIAGNSFGSSGTNSGIRVDNFCSDFDIVNCKIGPTAKITGDTHKYNVDIDSTSHDRYRVEGCTLTGGVTSTMIDGGTGASKVIRGNFGYVTELVPATNTRGWVGRGSIAAAADGVFTLLDTAGTAFTRLQFGGTTSSFPAVKRNSTALNFRLADDSADAPITAGSITTPAGAVNFLGTTTGSADTMAITASPAITTLTTGCVYSVKANAANATTTPTININGLGAKTLVKRVSTALAANDYLANMFIQLQYDGTNMVLLNPVVN